MEMDVKEDLKGGEGVWVHGGAPVFGFGPQSFKGWVILSNG